MPELTNMLGASVRKLLRPLVRILLRNGVPFATLAEHAKCVYVEVATEEFGIPGKKQTDSRVSILTGLSRKEVRRVRSLQLGDDLESIQQVNRAARVISGWTRLKQYQTSSGEPLALTIEGDGATFSSLVQACSGDVPPRAILDELLRVNAVEKLDDGRISLVERAYVPRTGENEKLVLLGTDVAYLISTIDHNLRDETGELYFQRKVLYDNLPEEAIRPFRDMTEEHGQALLELLDHWLVEHDRDGNPAVEGTGRKCAGLGIYFFEEDWRGPEKS
ncbi:MAG: DUF6502 family protein [Pseudomonadota bacterium]